VTTLTAASAASLSQIHVSTIWLSILETVLLQPLVKNKWQLMHKFSISHSVRLGIVSLVVSVQSRKCKAEGNPQPQVPYKV